jgi:hypothetical protein
MWKTVKAEGFFGLYKVSRRSSSYRNPRELLLTHRSLRHLQGSVAHVVRIAPHTVITLVANELICGQYAKLKQRFESDL